MYLCLRLDRFVFGLSEQGLVNGEASVCPIIRSQRAAAAQGLLLSAQEAGDIDRLLHCALSSECGQCHVDN